MASRAKDKKEMDPEEMLRRKFRAKCLFRALGRLVMANTYWLIEDIDEYVGVEDVKRRVEQAVKSKTKKQLLSVRDKALLNKPAHERTEHEKKYIYRIIGGLKCFKRYPNYVKRKLAAHTYFKYYGPGRTVVREKQEAHALYFIVSGDVLVTQMIYDELLEEYVSQEIMTMHAGDLFGEVSLLHNIPRTATVTTTEHCEFLQLLREDFKTILQTSVQKQWDEVKDAMSLFTYFDALDEVAIREGCLVAKMKNWLPNETILGDGNGIANHVYFLLSGRVQMIESLNIICTQHLGKNFYTLWDPWVPPEESEQDFEKKWFAAFQNRRSSDKSQPQIDTSKQEKTHGILKHETTRKSAMEVATSEEKVDGSVDNAEIEGAEKGTSEENIHHASKVKTEQMTDGAAKTSFGRNDSKARSMTIFVRAESTRAFEECSRLILNPKAESFIKRQESLRLSVTEGPRQLTEAEKKKLKTYFMQVCIMNPGSTFGFGENMRDRRIIALTPVSCMLMPKVWLLQRNTANIWTRIQYWLEKKIPKKDKLFVEFVKQRAWEDYKALLVDDVVARSNTSNCTTLHDVPYSIRLEEMYDI